MRRRSRRNRKPNRAARTSLASFALDEADVPQLERILSKKPAPPMLAGLATSSTCGLAIEASAEEFKPTYQSQTLRPIVSLAFVLPLILLHEICVIFIGQNDLRSGMDLWLDHFSSSLGLGQLFVLPLLTTGLLITWHHQKCDIWRIKLGVLAGMVLESCMLGLILFSAAGACVNLAQPTLTPTSLSLAEVFSRPDWWTHSIAAIGAGIYEELVFRLLLLLPVIRLIRSWKIDGGIAIVLGILATSLVFSSLHYDIINPTGVPFEANSFLFRAAASILFSLLFLFRGFGIAVGTHVAYDIFTQI